MTGRCRLMMVLAVARWEPPVLFVCSPMDRDLYLDGRGMVLIPSYFARRNVICLLDNSLPQAMVYPAARMKLARDLVPSREGLV